MAPSASCHCFPAQSDPLSAVIPSHPSSSNPVSAKSRPDKPAPPDRDPGVASAPAPSPEPAGTEVSGQEIPCAPPAAVPVPPRVLVVHADPALLRLIRESLEAFLHCEVRTTSSGLAAFDRVLAESYRLMLIDLHLPDLGGELLDDLISRAYPKVHQGTLTAPPVLWLGLPADHRRQDALTREARTKALITTPINIQRLLDTAAALLPGKPPP